MNSPIRRICRRLGVGDFRFVEIESKHRVAPEKAEDLKEHLLLRKRVKHKKTAVFFDQYLDTPRMALLRRGASLRLRYKRDGSFVYLQYKGPGFMRDGLLYRSEFSTERLQHLLLEESHHDIVHFADTSVREILREHAEPEMMKAMRSHLGDALIKGITTGPILCLYQKDKFEVDLGQAFLEPSLDRVFAFHISRKGPHPLSTFCEYENEIKASWGSLEAKLDHLDDLLEFDEKLVKRFDLRHERLDKYHRCASFFL